jgi:NADPH:quinone reductase-like Zn-dependent oxidoreductase
MVDVNLSRRSALGAIAGLGTGVVLANNEVPRSGGSTRGRQVTVEAWELGERKGIESLRRAARPQPRPGAGEVLIHVRASGLNHRDLAIVSGGYGVRARPQTLVPLGDGVGVIAELGAGVTGFNVGDRVTCPHFLNWHDGPFEPRVLDEDLGSSVDGWLTQQIVRPAAALVKVPDALSDVEAAALPAAGVTAWFALREFARVQAGETVLTLGTGGVSVTALQIARMCGARVAITSSSDEKLARMRQLGAQITVNYRTHADWEKRILEVTNGRGVDVVVDTVGGASFERALACMAPNGRIAMIGSLEGAVAPKLSNVMLRSLTVRGVMSGNRRMLESVMRAFAANEAKPVVDRVFSFADAPAAYRYLQSGAHVGKVVISHT